MQDKIVPVASLPGADAPSELLTLGWLQQFASPDESRVYIGSPFYHDGFAYATDGHLAVRIPSESFTEDKWKLERKETVLKSFAREGGQWWTITPPLESPIKEVACDACSGTGCDECFHCGHEAECSNCDGTGKRTTHASTEVGGVLFDVATLGRVWRLPGFTLRVHEADPMTAHLFRFNGGGGVVMPIRRKMDTHIDVEPKAGA
jgi:hypothetical protein